MRRALPGASAIGVTQLPFAAHVTVAPVDVPVSSTSGSGVVRAAPAALFQFGVATTPADSVEAIAVPLPTKSIPNPWSTAVGGGAVGTIWMALIGGRRVP